MGEVLSAHCRRPGLMRRAFVGVGLVCVLTLTSCGGDEHGAGAAPSVVQQTPSPQDSANASPKAEIDPDGEDGGDDGEPSAVPKAPPAPDAPPAPAAPEAGDEEPSDCDHKMPISPDELAVYRYTPEGGNLGLIVKYGNWGCASPDSDGPPFETVGNEIYQPLDLSAHITVTDPIVKSTENQPITVQKFLDWLETHPNSGLVFTYRLNSDGAVNHLEQVFIP